MNTEKALQDEGVFKTIFEKACNGLAIVGLDGAWIKVNQSICNMLGYTEDELYATNFQKLTHPEDLGDDITHLNKLISGDIANYKIEKRYIHKQGYVIWGLLSVTLVRDHQYQPLYFVSQINDITKQKKTEAERNTLTKIVQDKNKRLTSFAQIVTHNLRTHSTNLNLIKDFIKEDHQDFTTSKGYNLLVMAIDELKDTVGDLSELSQISKQSQGDLKQLNLLHHIQRCMHSINALVIMAKADLIIDVAPELTIKGIASYVDSIILNILTNAIKYRSKTRALRIVLTATITEDHIILKITDNGIGIDLKTHSKELFGLYKTFTDNEDSRGVGLYMTRAQIESIGGSIAVDSILNQGTTFALTFVKG